MKVLVTGATGQVGRELTTRGAEPLTRVDLDLTTAGTPAFATAARDLLAGVDVLVNCAAWTDVDGAEDEANTAQVEAVNAVAPGVLAAIAAEEGVRMIHVSTDYVFSGVAPEEDGRPRGWRVDDPVAPANAYGRTKAAGESDVLAAGGTVVRTSWVWSGPHAPGRDFVATMATLAERGVDPSVVDDQVGRPTYAADLAAGLWQLAAANGAGQGSVLHFQNSGDPVSWCGLAREVFAVTGHDPERVASCTTADWPTPAVRPPWSVLDLGPWESTVGTVPPAWQDGLARGLAIG